MKGKSVRLRWLEVRVVVDLLLACEDCAPFDDVGDVVLVVVLHVIIEVSLEFVKGLAVIIGSFTERLRESTFLCFFLDHLQQIVDHFVLVPQFWRQIEAAHGLQVGDLVT